MKFHEIETLQKFRNFEIKRLELPFNLAEIYLRKRIVLRIKIIHNQGINLNFNLNASS